jgi:hypothetical protein
VGARAILSPYTLKPPLPLEGNHSGPAILWSPYAGRGSLHLSDGGLQQAAGSSDIIAARVWATSQAPAWWPVPAHFTNAAYRLSHPDRRGLGPRVCLRSDC